ncbi:MAG: TRAP transporter small permease subunit [Synergistaceae bacterium]|nr:TRAP transporter small permease subunit [Synergistaceae bacterium]
MTVVKWFYGIVCKVEETLATIGLLAMTALILLSAVSRFLGYPVNWAVDISLLIFAWIAFMGADVGIRQNRIINVDFLTSKFPLKYQKGLAVLWSVVIILFLAILVVYGTSLSLSNVKRQFQSIPLSYSYVTASLPVCSFFMIISMLIKLKKQVFDFSSTRKTGGLDAV